MSVTSTTQDFRELVGDRIVQIRGKMSQKKFGELLNLTRKQVSTMERGEVPIPGEVFVAINRKFGVSLIWLLLGDGQPTYAPGDQLTKEECEFLNFVRSAPEVLQEVLPLVKKAVAYNRISSEFPLKFMDFSVRSGVCTGNVNIKSGNIQVKSGQVNVNGDVNVGI
ncbi:putative Transcriptional regulator [Gammaproteobacteria bacterium]